VPQAGRYYRKTAVKIHAIMCHLYKGMNGKSVPKVVNTRAMMIPDIRYAAFSKKTTEPCIEGLRIAVTAIAFDKEKTVRRTYMPDRYFVPIICILL
jgi:hypothetical protein